MASSCVSWLLEKSAVYSFEILRRIALFRYFRTYPANRFSRRGVTNECNANKLPKTSISIKPNSKRVCASSSCSNLENKHEIYSLAQQTAASEQKEQHHQAAETEKEPEKAADPEIIAQETKETVNTPIHTSELQAKPLQLESEKVEKTIEETKTIATIPPVTATSTADQIKQLPESNPYKQILQAELLIKRENHSPGPRTITAQLLSGSSSGLRPEEKRPKSVTASVLRPSPAPPLTPPPTAVLCKKTPLGVEPNLPPTTTATAAIISSSNQQLQIAQQNQLQNPQQPAQDMSKGFCSLFADDGRGLTSKYQPPSPLIYIWIQGNVTEISIFYLSQTLKNSRTMHLSTLRFSFPN